MIDRELIEKAEKLLEKEMKKIVDKGDLTPTELDNLKKALCIADMLEGQSSGMYMDDPDMSYGWNIQRTRPYMDDMNGMSGRRGRSSVTGRYISRGMDQMNSSTNGMTYGQSGHSIEDRMIASLEQQMDNASSSYERQMIQEEINHIRMRNR